jgi:hypothetical protein
MNNLWGKLNSYFCRPTVLLMAIPNEGFVAKIRENYSFSVEWSLYDQIAYADPRVCDVIVSQLGKLQ